MAQKRMFDKAIIDTDRFMDLPISTKALYFLLGMEADDEGFVSSKKVIKIHGGSDDDLKVLLAKNFVIQFPSGVVVITEWHKNNWLDTRRIKETEYTIEKEQILLTDDRKYVLSSSLASIEESRIEESSIEQNRNKVRKDNRNPEIQEIWEYGVSLGFTSKKEHINRYAITRLLKEIPKDRLKQIIEYARKIQDQQYAPRIYNFLDLEEKLPKLKDFADRQKAKQPKTIDLTNL